MEFRQHFNRTPGIEGEMSIRFDLATGRVRAVGSGFWAVDQARVFFRDWKQMVWSIREHGHPVSALVDMSESAIQCAEVTDMIVDITAGLYQDGDYIAMLLATSLAKMQMRRVLDQRFHEFFLSREAAEMWLEGKAQGKPALDRAFAS